MFFKTANVTQLDQFDEIIDVRTPLEFAEDHIQGAINCPVLSNEERAIVGTIYAQASPFEARKVGAAMIARNIAVHLDKSFHAHPKSWRPLVYCWRGGQRSGAMSIILSQVGWSVHKLQGGYKAYRRDVLEKLQTIPRGLSFRVVCGPTGSGKSRLLAALAATGHQVLDLEFLARHRGSVLGKLPHQEQPSQKLFDSMLVQNLNGLDPSQPVFVEAESSKIGVISLPAALIDAMHASRCLALEAQLETRVSSLLGDYRHYLENPESLVEHLKSLYRFHGATTLGLWNALIKEGKFEELVTDLLVRHYDPSYMRATSRHYPNLAKAPRIQLSSLSPEALRTVAEGL
jgi:tRNA 2-selenouridine synthase